MSELKRYVVRESIANQGFSIRDNTELHPHTIMPPDDVCALLNDLTEKVTQLEAFQQFVNDNAEYLLKTTPNAVIMKAKDGQYPLIESLIANYIFMKAECERLRVDAARYRWLRYGGNGELVIVAHGRNNYPDLLRAECLDAAIDAQLTKDQSNDAT